MLSRLQQFDERMHELKQSEYGQKVALVDATIGRIYGWLIAVIWFVLAACAPGIASLASSFVSDTLASLLSISSISIAVYAAIRGCGGLLSSRDASEIMIDELQKRYKPLSWAVDIFTSGRGHVEAKAD